MYTYLSSVAPFWQTTTCLALALCALPAAVDDSANGPTVGLRVGHPWVFDVAGMTPSLRALLPADSVIQRIDFISLDSTRKPTITRDSETRLTVTLRTTGIHPTRIECVYSTPGSSAPQITTRAVNIIGYRLLTAGAVRPVYEPQAGPTYGAFVTEYATATVIMEPYVPGVAMKFSMFAHKATFTDGVRTFTSDTSGGPTSTGEAGWVEEIQSDGKHIGKIAFRMIIPPKSNSFCFKIVQAQTLSFLSPASIATVHRP